MFDFCTLHRALRHMPCRRRVAAVQDHRKPATGRLTYDHAGHSVCRVQDDLPDEWLVRERRRIGRCIRDARLDRNLTQERVFLAVPLNRAFYQQIEAGEANPTLDTLLRIARVLGIPVSHLLGD